MDSPVTLETVERLHRLDSLFHAFIYFCPEAKAAYEAVGAEGGVGYFASRSAPMGPVPAEVVVATFYNFSPALVIETMKGAWDKFTPAAVQLARWKAAKEVLDGTARAALSDDDIARAVTIAQDACDNLDWSGRTLAAANYAVLDDLARSELGDDALLRLWQLITILREWRGDAHIGVLIAEPLTGTECTVITHAQKGGFTKASRAWPEQEWADAVATLSRRGWLTDEDTLTEFGRRERDRIEEVTNELSTVIWRGVDDATVNELGDILQKAVDALAEGGYLKPLGLRPSSE